MHLRIFIKESDMKMVSTTSDCALRYSTTQCKRRRIRSGHIIKAPIGFHHGTFFVCVLSVHFTCAYDIIQMEKIYMTKCVKNYESKATKTDATAAVYFIRALRLECKL